jgi:integrase
MTFDLAAGRYWAEKGQYHRNHKDTKRQIAMLVKFFGPTKRLDEITDNDVTALVAWRRKQEIKRSTKKKAKDEPAKMEFAKTVSNSTVNRTALVPLKAIFTRARKTWKLHLPKEPDWTEHWLDMPDERVRMLDAHEAEALDASVRDDYADWFEFARITGLRRNETLIRWSNVNWFAKRIETTGKRGKKVATPITPSVKAILEGCRGHHPEYVFTYVSKRPKGDQKKGTRYPITPEGAKTQWRRLSKRSGVKDFRFHDIRHDVAMNLLRDTGNMRLVQQALNHASITTTTKYASVQDEELAAALERNAKSPKKSPSNTSEAA